MDFYHFRNLLQGVLLRISMDRYGFSYMWQGVPRRISIDFYDFHIFCKGGPLGFQWISIHVARSTPGGFNRFLQFSQILQGGTLRISIDLYQLSYMLQGVPLRISIDLYDFHKFGKGGPLEFCRDIINLRTESCFQSPWAAAPRPARQLCRDFLFFLFV